MNRASAYGDGLFETMCWSRGRVRYWDYHWQRLCAGLARLQIAQPKEDSMVDNINTACAQRARAVIRLQVSRKAGERGYRPILGQPGELTIEVSDYPGQTVARKRRGIDVRILPYPLPTQTSLAGMKTLNRLDQVLASGMLDETEWDGLLCDYDGRLIGSTCANLWIRIGETVYTPEVRHTGIAGVMRAVLIAQMPSPFQVLEKPLFCDVLKHCEEVFLSNAVMGICSIRSVNGLTMPSQRLARQLIDSGMMPEQ